MEKIRKIREKVKCTFQKICDSIKNIRSEAAFYKNLWDRPEGKAAAALCMGQIVYLIKKIRPKKLEGEIVFGTGDPASTGQVLGVLGAFYGFMPEKLQITPDFEEKRYEGHISAKGKLRLIHVLLAAGRLILDKNFRYAAKQLLDKEDVKDEQQ